MIARVSARRPVIERLKRIGCSTKRYEKYVGIERGEGGDRERERAVREEDAGEHDRRPVPQVPAVGDVADPHHRPAAEGPRHPALRAQSGDDEQRGSAHRDERDRAREQRGARQYPRTPKHKNDPDHARDQGAVRLDAGEVGDEQGQERADRELPGPGQRRVVREPRRRGQELAERAPGCAHTDEERDQADDSHDPRHRGAHRETRCVTAGCVNRQREQQREHDVELLFHRERPRVQQRVRVERGVEVTDLGAVEVAVGEERRRRRAGGRGLALGQDRVLERGRRHRDGHDQQGECGKDAAHPAGVERGEAQAVRRGEFAPQQLRDDETGDDEEHVDADVTPRQRQPGVEGHDQEHGEPAEALDVGAVRDRWRCDDARRRAALFLGYDHEAPRLPVSRPEA